MTDTFWRVAVEAPLKEALTYKAEAHLLPELGRGVPVQVPLGRRSVFGVILGEETSPSQDFAIKNISGFCTFRPKLPEDFLGWVEFLSHYYCYPVGPILETVFPPLEKKERKRKSTKTSLTPEQELEIPPQLTGEQHQVIESVRENLNEFGVHLLFGITGSGKTEVYLRLIDEVVARGQSVIVLVPEISLTPQLINRFIKRLGQEVAVFHSQLTSREKTDQWWLAHEAKKKVFVGARSALFCPIENVGLIIVDEEHEQSFKQEDRLRYHARDAAIMRAKFANCPIVLGSATPSLESWSNAQSGKYKLYRLSYRAKALPLPTIEIVDMRVEHAQQNEHVWNERVPKWMSQKLYLALIETLENKEQAALFLNRRGMAHSVVGPKTGACPECPNCDVSLTLHGRTHLVCHYCNYSTSMTQAAKELGERELIPLGVGTEKLEEELQMLFPTARLARADRDEIQNREDLEAFITSIENNEVDLIVGTQMIAKGLDFENLSLVGLVLADIGFNLPDFRSNERSFQVITQVSGRPGRHKKAGRVIIQTYNPEHASLRFAKTHDYESFAEFELGFREDTQYPPTWRMAAFRISGLHKTKVEASSRELGAILRGLTKKHRQLAGVKILGPAPAPLARIKNQSRYHIFLRTPSSAVMQTFCHLAMQVIGDKLKDVRIHLDIDPYQML